ncbi:hypothetical protein ACJZ2D_002428 [Fusarium nematophilum]
MPSSIFSALRAGTDNNRSLSRPKSNGWRLSRHRCRAQVTCQGGSSNENDSATCNPRSSSDSFVSSHRSRWFASKRRKTISSFTAWTATLPISAGCRDSSNLALQALYSAESRPTGLHPRTSLSDAFQHVRARWSREKSSDSDTALLPTDSTTKDDGSPEATENMFLKPFVPIVEKGPPQLDVLSDLSRCSLERSSTLRACIERAGGDASVGEGSFRPLPEIKAWHRQPGRKLTSTVNRKVTPIPIPTVTSPQRRRVVLETSSAGSHEHSYSQIAEAGSCSACGSRRCCRRKSEEGLLVQWNDLILGGSLPLRNPSEQEQLDIGIDFVSSSSSSSITTLELPRGVLSDRPNDVEVSTPEVESQPVSSTKQQPFSVDDEGWSEETYSILTSRRRSVERNNSEASLSSCSSTVTTLLRDPIPFPRVRRVKFDEQDHETRDQFTINT